MNNRELVLSYLNAFATGDPTVIAGHVSDDFENIQLGVLGTGCTGKDAYRRRLGNFLTEFPNLQYAVENLIVEDGNVAAMYKMTFTRNDQAFDIQGVMIFTILDGRIAVRRDYWDGLSYQQQASTPSR